MADLFIQTDGEWVPVGKVNSISYTVVEEDGTETVPPGVCPICRTRPLDGEPHVCPHGVVLP